jgi:hypothetical protein
MADPTKTGDALEPDEAARSVVSLSQVLLAPLDALFKAQVHAARSFLNFVLQLSYEDKAPATGGAAAASAGAPKQPDTIFSIDFVQKVPPLPPATPGGQPGPERLQKVSVPVLALVPLRPLAVQEAEFNLAMEVTWVGRHRQMRKQPVRAGASAAEAAAAEKKQPPWYLVREPISLRGLVAASPSNDAGDKRLIKVNVKLAPVATPAGLEKLLTTLTQSASASDVDGTGNG